MPEPAIFHSKEAMRRFDLTRTALAQCIFPPGSPPKRFARQVSQMPLENITEGQRRYVIRLAYRFRRQMPSDLVPNKDAIEALDAAWNAKREEQAVRRKVPVVKAAPDLLDYIGGMHA